MRVAESSVLCQCCKLQHNEGKYNEGTDERKPCVHAALLCLMGQIHTHQICNSLNYNYTRMLCSKIHNRKPLLWNPECIRVNSMLCSFLVTPVAARPWCSVSLVSWKWACLFPEPASFKCFLQKGSFFFFFSKELLNYFLRSSNYFPELRAVITWSRSFVFLGN